MKTFPMFLQMQDRHVVIAGGGEQAAQKCRLMLKTCAKIKVLAPALDAELAMLHSEGRIEWRSDPVTTTHFENTALVFIATGCPGSDASLHSLAKAAGAVVNVVDQPHLCDALTPSIVDRSPVVVAIGTEGTAPVLARQIKTRVEELLEPRLGDLAALAGRLRDRASMRLGSRDRRDLWRWVFAGPVRNAHANGAERDAARMLKEAIETANFGTQTGGSIAIVGAGPGDKDLMTLRAVQRLQEADLIIYDNDVSLEVLDLARRDAERMFVGNSVGCAPWPEKKVSDVFVAEALRGKRVVVLKAGDATSFSIANLGQSTLNSQRVSLEVVPGIASVTETTGADQRNMFRKAV